MTQKTSILSVLIDSIWKSTMIQSVSLFIALFMHRINCASTFLLISPPVSHLVSNHPEDTHNVQISSNGFSPLQEHIRTWSMSSNDRWHQSLTIAATSIPPPSSEDVAVLRAAFAEMYRPLNKGEVVRDYEKAHALLSDAIDRWKDQPADERAGLYRVRGDCNMLRDAGNDLKVAQAAFLDYDMAVSLLKPPSNADPSEYPAALLGRARASKSLVTLSSPKERPRYAFSAAKDYRLGLIELGRLNNMEDDEIYDDGDRLEEGMQRNPYATWEYGDALFKSGSDFTKASSIYVRAGEAFAAIGDRPRSVLSQIDAGIALAAAGDSQIKPAEDDLRIAVQNTVGVESRNVPLLQRVIEKEGEGRMALAALLWSDGQRAEAESILGEACVRLDQLQAQVDENAARNKQPASSISLLVEEKPRLVYSIDDQFLGRNFLSCSDFKKPQFVAEQLEWPDSLQRKVIKLETLQ
jgi:hypothetical protein